MSSPAITMCQDLLAQIQDDQATASETIDFLRGQLDDMVAANSRLQERLGILVHEAEMLRRERDTLRSAANGQ